MTLAEELRSRNFSMYLLGGAYADQPHAISLANSVLLPGIYGQWLVHQSVSLALEPSFSRDTKPAGVVFGWSVK